MGAPRSVGDGIQDLAGVVLKAGVRQGRTNTFSVGERPDLVVGPRAERIPISVGEEGGEVVAGLRAHDQHHAGRELKHSQFLGDVSGGARHPPRQNTIGMIEAIDDDGNPAVGPLLGSGGEHVLKLARPGREPGGAVGGKGRVGVEELGDHAAKRRFHSGASLPDVIEQVDEAEVNGDDPAFRHEPLSENVEEPRLARARGSNHGDTVGGTKPAYKRIQLDIAADNTMRIDREMFFDSAVVHPQGQGGDHLLGYSPRTAGSRRLCEMDQVGGSVSEVPVVVGGPANPNPVVEEAQ